MHRVVSVSGHAHLLEVVGALDAAGGLAHLLHRGQEQADEDGDDGDHHQQLNERERRPARRTDHSASLSQTSDGGYACQRARGQGREVGVRSPRPYSAPPTVEKAIPPRLVPALSVWTSCPSFKSTTATPL